MNSNEYHSAIVVDIDGTLCSVKSSNQNYAELKPNMRFVKKLQIYQEMGFKIILFTSRNMNTFKGNLGLINKHTAPVLIEWLRKWNIPYDEIMFGKPWAFGRGFYVDDKAIRPNEFLKYSDHEIYSMLANED